jgi:hypothetical protein
MAGAGGVAGCSSSSGTSGPDASAVEDATTDSVPPSEDGGEGGALVDVDASAPAVRPRVTLVHASPDAPPLRFCLGVVAPGDAGVVVSGGYAPSAVLAPATAAALDDHGVDLDTLGVVILALDATNPAVVASTAPADGGLGTPCESLVGYDGRGAPLAPPDAGDAGLVPGRDFWLLGMLSAGSLGHGTSWLGAVTGCTAGEGAASSLCPSGYDPTTGDLSLVAWKLDTSTAVEAGALGAQLAQASSEWDDFARANGGAVSAGFIVAGTGTALPLATDASFGALAPATLEQVGGLAFDGTTSFFATVAGPDGAVPPTPLTWTLPAVQAASWPGAVPEAGVLRDGAGFVFVLLGNPAVAAASDAGPEGGAPGRPPRLLALPVGP